MALHPAIITWLKRGLINQIEAIYLGQRMKRQGDTPESALALGGFKNTAPFFAALEDKGSHEAPDRVDIPENPLFAEMTFTTFIQTNSYMPAVETVYRVCRDSPFQSKFPSIFGRRGQGKTHLLNAAEKEIRKYNPDKRTVLVNMLDLALALQRAKRRGTRNDFINFLCQIDNLLIDDVQFCEADGQLQASLLEVMERQPALPGHRLLFSCDVKPDQLQLSESGLKSTIEKITPVELKPLDKAERSLMVHKLAGGTNLPVDIRNYIAENVTGSTGELKAAVNQLIAAARESGNKISLELTGQIIALSTMDGSQQPEPVADPQALKEMVRSAQNEAEHILANQVSLSQMIKKLNSAGQAANRPLAARLQVALQALREGDLPTASELIQGL